VAEVVPSGAAMGAALAAGVGPSGAVPVAEVAPAPSGAALGAASTVGVGPSRVAMEAASAAGVGPLGVATGAGASGRGHALGGGTGGRVRALGGGHGGGADNRGHAVEGSEVRGEEQLGWIRGEELVRGCFSSDPIAYGEEKRFKGILVSLDDKNDLE
jgi:hypothetical protein